MKKYLLALSGVALILGGCSNKTEHVYIDLYKSCYQKEYQLSLGEIRSSEDNELNISFEEARDALNQALRDSNCFEINGGGGYSAGYSTDLIYSSKVIKDRVEKNFATSEEKVYLIVEAVITMQNFNETKTYRGKSQIEMSNTKILGLGSTPEASKSDRTRALHTAIRSAVKEASDNIRRHR
ncbi:MAG: hypothetical protein ACTTJS_07805 [Wolinella sp.]